MRPKLGLLLVADLDQLADELRGTPPIDSALASMSRLFDRARGCVTGFQDNAGRRLEDGATDSLTSLVEALRMRFLRHSWGGESASREAAVPAVVLPELQVRGRALLDALTVALEAADRALTDQPSRKPDRAAWADDPDLLGLFQDLLASGLTGDGGSALRRISSLRRELRAGHQIQVYEYSPVREHCFDVEIDLSGSSKERTLAPALVIGEVVLKRGLARLPAGGPGSTMLTKPLRADQPSGEREAQSTSGRYRAENQDQQMGAQPTGPTEPRQGSLPL